MNCPACNHDIPDAVVHCPYCSAYTRKTVPTIEPEITDDQADPATRIASYHRFHRAMLAAYSLGLDCSTALIFVKLAHHGWRDFPGKAWLSRNTGLSAVQVQHGLSHLAETKLLMDDGKGAYRFCIPELVIYDIARITRMEQMRMAEAEASVIPDAEP